MIDRLLGLNYRASIESPSFDLNSIEAVNSLIDAGYESDSGLKVSGESAQRLPPVWQAISLISGGIAGLPLDLYQRVGNEDRKVDDKHSAYMPVRRKANNEQSAFDFWRKFMVHALLWNNAYAYIDRSASGRVLGLYHLLPDRTVKERINGKLYCVTETNGQLKPIPAENVLHVTNGISFDGVKGYETIKAARDAFGVALAIQKFAAKFFKHGVRTGGILEVPVGMPENAQTNLFQGFKKMHESVDQWFKVAILRDGAKFHQTSIPPENAQMDESRESQVRDIARVFNLAPSKLGLSDSVSYNSKSEDNQAYLNDTLAPWLNAIVSECWMKLLTAEEQRKDTHYFEHNTGALLRMNTQTRYQTYAIGIRNRILNPNECRRMENLSPYEGGDEYLGDGAKQIQPGSSDGGADKTTNQNVDNQGTGDAGKRSLVRMRVIFGLAAHARTKSKNPKAFLEWIDGGLQSHRSTAKELIGTDEDIAAALEQFKGLAERTTEAELPSAVDQLVTALEKEVSGVEHE